MTCDDLDNLLQPYVDGEFDAEGGVELEQHLSACNGCMRRVMQERHFREILRARAREGSSFAPESLRRGIQMGIHQEVRRTQFRQAITFSAAAALAATVGAGAWAWWPHERDRFLEDAARRHARALPSEITDSAYDRVEVWFAGKLDHRVPVPRFPGAQVAGARISNVSDRPAAYISYKTPDLEGHPRTIGLFVFDDSRDEVGANPLPQLQLAKRLGYNVALWREGEIVYEMVTDLDEGDIRALFKAQQGGGERRTAPMAAPTPTLDVTPASLRP